MKRLQVEMKERAYKKKSVLEEAEKRYSGSWFKKYQTQSEQLEEDVDAHKRPAGSGRMLDEFIRQGDER